MFFLLTEYSLAGESFVDSAIHALARAKDPILAQIPIETSTSLPGRTRISVAPGEVLDTEPFLTETPFSLTTSDVIAGDYSGMYLSLDQSADELLKQLIPSLFGYVGDVTEATGNVVSNAGKPLTWDTVLDVLEKIDMSFDEEGKPNIQLVTSPQTKERFDSLPPPTADQQTRADEIYTRKQEEADARRRHRRLHSVTWGAGL